MENQRLCRNGEFWFLFFDLGLPLLLFYSLVVLASPTEGGARLRGVAPGDDNHPLTLSSSDCTDAPGELTNVALSFSLRERNGPIVCTLATQLTSVQRSTLQVSDGKALFFSCLLRRALRLRVSRVWTLTAEQRMLGDVPSERGRQIKARLPSSVDSVLVLSPLEEPVNHISAADPDPYLRLRLHRPFSA